MTKAERHHEQQKAEAQKMIQWWPEDFRRAMLAALKDQAARSE